MNHMKVLKAAVGLGVVAWALVLGGKARGENYKPAVEYTSLMNLRFDEAYGSLLVEELQMVFPPADGQPLKILAAKANGENFKDVASVPLRVNKWGGFPIFDGLMPDGTPGHMSLGEAGNYVIGVFSGRQLLTSLTFTMKVEESGDPFNPGKTFTRDGPWAGLAYLSHPVDDQEKRLSFNWWTNLREMPDGTRAAKCTAHLMAGDDEIATTAPASVHVGSANWRFFHRRLVQTGSRGRPLSLADLTGRDGEYRMVLKADGKPVKTYGVVVNRGSLQRLDHSRLDYEPHNLFLSPRIVDTSPENNHDFMIDAYWVKTVGRP